MSSRETGSYVAYEIVVEPGKGPVERDVVPAAGHDAVVESNSSYERRLAGVPLITRLRHRWCLRWLAICNILRILSSILVP